MGWAELLEAAGDLLYDTIVRDPQLYLQPDFHRSLAADVVKLLTVQLAQVPLPPACLINVGLINVGLMNVGLMNVDLLGVDLLDVDLVVEEAFEIFYAEVAPRRSHATSFALAPKALGQGPKALGQRQQLARLLQIPQPEQRTPAWYAFRHENLTASSIWKAFGSDSARNQLIYEKCKPLNTDKYQSVATESPMHWGQRYEPLSIRLYEQFYQVQVSDFGCLPHRTLAFLAASPDGIVTAPVSNGRYGRMLEVKNIFNRDIDGVPKLEYWVQMQIQMEVCELFVCDFLETRFLEYADLAAFELDGGTYNLTQHGQPKGVIMCFMRNGLPFYEYGSAETCAESEQWEADTMQKHAGLSWTQNLYWHLDEFSCVLVERNQFWFAHATPTLTALWATIVQEKASGQYAHRAPKKRQEKVGAQAGAQAQAQAGAQAQAQAGAQAQARCFIDISDL